MDSTNIGIQQANIELEDHPRPKFISQLRAFSSQCSIAHYNVPTASMPPYVQYCIRHLFPAHTVVELCFYQYVQYTRNSSQCERY